MSAARALPAAVAVLLVALVAPRPAPAQSPAQSANDALLLTASPPEVAEGADYGLLLREIGRQALLIAARDELRLPTRDDALQEPLPPEARPFAVTVLVRPKQSYRIRLSRDGTALWEKDVPIVQRPELAVDIDQLVEKFEALSRGEMVAALKKAGLKPRRAEAALAGAALPADAEQLLWQTDFLAPFEAVREAHAQVREHGESRALLGALVRGYANLGQLLRFLWAPAHKVFEARSLLYAQRLVAKNHADPLALYHRAYARAMVGLHASALKDLDAADAAAKTAGNFEPPPWARLVRSLCRYDTADLTEASRAGGEAAPLAMYLAFLTVETCNSQAVEVGVAEAALRVNPDCLRLVDALCDRTGPGPLNAMTDAGPTMFGRTLGTRLQTLSLPQPVKDELAKQREAAAGAPRRAPGRGGSIPTGRPATINLLLDNGAVGRDEGEPSAAALGRLIQEVTFAHVRRRADLIAVKWSQDARAYAAAVGPLLAGHRYAKLIEAYGLFHSNGPRVWGKPLAEIQPKDTELSALPMFNLMRQAFPVPGEPGSPFYLTINSTDDVAWDMERVCTILSHPRGNPDLPQHLQRLKEISPFTPVVAAITIKSNWAAAEPQIADWEQKFGNHPALTDALAWKYLNLKRYDEAERWARRYVEAVPGAAAYAFLAESYRLRGDDEAWVQTMEKAATSGNVTGLDGVKVQVRIAEHLLVKGKTAEALTHADEAASSGAAWAMNCAMVANERAGNWDAAERLARENSDHYDDPERYLVWCVRTGKGDLARAKAAALDHLKGVTDASDREELAGVGAIHLLLGRPNEALAGLKALYEPTGDPWAGVNAAVIAPDAATRDAALGAVLADRKPVPPETAQRPQLVEFARWLKDNWEKGADPALDLSAVDKIVAKCAKRPSDASVINYCAAKFLQTHHRDADATTYFKHAAAMLLVESPGTNQALAWKELRNKGIEPATLSLEPPPGHNELLPEIRRDE